MKKKIIVILSLVILIVGGALTVTNKYDHNNTFKTQVKNKDNIKYIPIAEDIGGVSHGILDVDGHIDDTFVHELEEGETFDKFVNIANFFDGKRNFKLLAFVNFKQVDFKVDGDIVSEYDFTLESKEDIQIPVTLENFNIGLNEIMFSIAISPYKEISDEVRIATELSHMIHLRTIVAMGSDEMPTINFLDVKLNDNSVGGVFITKGTEELRLYPSTTLKRGDTLKLDMNVGHTNGSDTTEYALILLKDWKQVDIIDNMSVIYLNLPENKHTWIPIEMTFEEKGLFNVSAILVENPYTAKSFKSMQTSNSLRIGVTVE